MPEIIVTLDEYEMKHGSGEHWYRYVATWADAHNDKRGYGDTEREARLSLQKQEGA